MVTGSLRASAIASLAFLLGQTGLAPAQIIDRVFHSPNPYAVESDGRYGPPPLPSTIIPGTLGYPYQRHYGGMHPSIWGEELTLPLPPGRLIKSPPPGPGDLIYVATPVIIDINVPDGAAKVSFDDRPTHQEGTTRSFSTPPLRPGMVFSYEVKAIWKEQGQEIVRTRKIDVKAGDHVTMTFKKPKPADAAP